jgi:hypothetical protein
MKKLFCFLFFSLIGCTPLKDQYKIGECYAITDIKKVGVIVQINSSSIIVRTEQGGYVIFDTEVLAKVPNNWCEGIYK